MSEENKAGPWSKQERNFIQENHDKLSPIQIAKHLRRNPKAVEKYIKEEVGSPYYKIAKEAAELIQNSPVWDDINSQFNESEREMFLFQYGRIVAQFKDDVLPTEEMQIIDTIKLDILMNRSLKNQQKINESIKKIENELRDEVDPMKIDSLQRELTQIRAGQTASNKDYQEMLNRKGSILKDMKATRDARIKDIQSGKENFLTWMRKIIEDKELREKLGTDLEKMRLATKVEFERLSELHTYSDGVLDQPILTSDNVIGDEEEYNEDSTN